MLTGIKDNEAIAAGYKIDSIVDYEPQLEVNNLNRVCWISLGAKEGKLEPIGHLPRRKQLQYHRYKTIPVPMDFSITRVG